MESLKVIQQLYDSFGEDLKEGDKFVCIDRDGIQYEDECIIRYSEHHNGLFSMGIISSHNSWENNGKPQNCWKVIKVIK